MAPANALGQGDHHRWANHRTQQAGGRALQQPHVQAAPVGRRGFHHQGLRKRQDRTFGQPHYAAEQQQSQEAAHQPGQCRAQREERHGGYQQRFANAGAIRPGTDQRAGDGPGQCQHRGEHAQVAVAELQLVGHEGKKEGQRQTIEEDETESEEQHAEQGVLVSGVGIVMRHVVLLPGAARGTRGVGQRNRLSMWPAPRPIFS
ncbi:hypothetical protein D9M68_756750 [compost metagenome]